MQLRQQNYQKLKKKLENNPDYVYDLPTVKLVINEIESNSEYDGEPLYQNQKVYYYSREKQYIKNHCLEIVDAIISCYEERYGNLFDKDSTVNVHSDQGDTMLFEICRVLNCSLWPSKESCDFDQGDQVFLCRKLL